MAQLAPPKKLGPLAKREERLAWILLLPTVIAVALVIILPLASIFWISFKPIKLSDLRAPTVLFKESFHGKPTQAGDLGEIRYKLRNSSRELSIKNITLIDLLPVGVTITQLDSRCDLKNKVLRCNLGSYPGGYRETIKIPVLITTPYLESKVSPKNSVPILSGNSDYILTNFEFSFENFKNIFDRKEFYQVLYVTLFYTVFGTLGALVLGLAAALILDKTFKGQAILRGLFLFPYVAPVIAVAFTWVMLLDPFSGSINALLIQMNLIESPINFFGRKPLALFMVTAFEIWRYFPLSFLFILARMQSIDGDMYEAAEMDGASPFQQFFYLSIPMLAGILSVLFLLRFIWTFNKFDDIFLLTGGNAGTRTLTVNVYEQAFAISNIGAGAAVAVVIFTCLILFSIFFFRFINREEGL
jgi:multiple sugar transport system permease protein